MAVNALLRHRQSCTLPRSTSRTSAKPAFSGPRLRNHRSVVVPLKASAEEAPAAAVPLEQTGNDYKAVLDIEQIKKVLPHRYPFLLVDRVVEVEREKYAIGYKNVTVNDQFFNGHFPERSIMPGVLQVEALAQLGGIAMLDPEDEEGKQLFFFGGVENCRFRKPVVPGDTLMMRVDVTKYNKRFGVVKLAAKGYVGSTLAIEADLTLAMGKPPK